jgi:hypothetical protein
MAAANDNQGLKIAVAALVMLVFILGVTNYFAFSAASQNLAKADKAADDSNKASKQYRDAVERENFYRTAIGYVSLEDFDAAKAAMTKDNQRILAELQGIQTETGTSITEFQKGGAPDPKLDDLKNVFLSLGAAFASEPNENRVYVKSLERLKDLMVNISRINRELSLDYLKLRRELGAANGVNSVEIAKVSSARDKAVEEKQQEVAKIKTEIQALYEQITALQTSDKEKTNTITDLTNKLADVNQKFTRYTGDVSIKLQDLKDRLSLNTNQLGKAIGHVSMVDYPRREVRVDITKATGAKPMMVFTLFDETARGIPTDKPKGTIELVSIGEFDSLARIVETKDPTNPIRRYDQIYSPAFTPDNPQRFALVGKIDINRDGRDDRADLIRLIEQSGGYVEYDLPPPGVDRTPGRLAVERTFAKLNEVVPPVTGRSSGHISPLTKAYIYDDLNSLRDPAISQKVEQLTPEGQQFSKEYSDATREARANGVQPMRLARLLTELGYSPPPGGLVPGSVEMRNRAASKMILKPRANPGPATPPAATTPAPGPAPATTPPAATTPPVEDPKAPK